MQGLRLETLLQLLGLDTESLGKINLGDSPNTGSLELREEIAKLHPGALSENVLVTTGTSEGLFLFFSEILRQGDKVGYYSPAFQSLYEIPLGLGAELYGIPVAGEGHLPIPNRKDFKLFICNHPHNPTGLGFGNKFKELWTHYLQSYSGYLLFDEHYRFLPHEPSISLLPTGAFLNEKTFVTGSCIKCFGITGLRVGWIIGSPDLLKVLRQKKDYTTHTVSPISEFLVTEVMRQRQKFQDLAISRILKNLEIWDFYAKELPGIQSFQRPEGGLVIWVQLDSKIPSAIYADHLYEKTGVFVLPGSDFETEGYLRIGLGEETERFEKGLERWRQMKFLAG